MKSYFSRFLHHTMSYLGGKPDTSSSLSYSDLIGVSRSNQVANLFHLDYRVKFENDGFCTGRSMVEMLGVLAIIGVLSVGAIAGYSKAMFKYKLNKHAEAFNLLLNDVLRYSSELKQEENGVYYGEFFYKLGLIPDGFKYQNESSILDNFGNGLAIYATNLSSNYKGGISIYLNSVQKEVCYNFVQTAKENSANLWMLESMVKVNSSYQGHIYGDKYCTRNNKCLKNLKVSDFEALCDTDKVSWLYILWR